VRRTLRNRPLFLRALLAGCLCVPAFAGEARPDVSWDQIESWALGDALTVALTAQKSDPKPDKIDKTDKPDPKVAAAPEAAPAKPEPAKTEVKAPEPVVEARLVIPAPKSTSRRADPREYADLKGKFLQRASTRLQRLEADRVWDQAYDLSYKTENYAKCVELIGRMLQDKRYMHRDFEVWASGKMWEIGLLSNQMNNQTVDFHFKTWKERAAKAIEEGKFVRGDIPHELPQVQIREAFYKSWGQGLSDDLKKMEAAGEDTPKYLWELAIRFHDDAKPAWPMHYMNLLLKLREWHPEFDPVKSGEVQTRLSRLLWEQFNMPKESCDEAERALEKFPKHPSVVNGDMCWIAAEGTRQLAFEQKTNREGFEFFKQAKQWYETYQKKFGGGQYNKRNGDDPKSEVQKRIEETNKNIEIRQVRNK